MICLFLSIFDCYIFSHRIILVITFLDDVELLLCVWPPESSDNEVILSVEWQFLTLPIPRGGVDPVKFSGDDSSVKLCKGGEASLPEFAPFLDPTTRDILIELLLFLRTFWQNY